MDCSSWALQYSCCTAAKNRCSAGPAPPSRHRTLVLWEGTRQVPSNSV